MQPRYLSGPVALALVLSACTGSTAAGGGADAGSDSVSGDDGSIDVTGTTEAGTPSDASRGADAAEASPGGEDAAPETGTSGVQCGVQGPPSFPTFDKTCSTAADCALVVHTLSCCGNVLVMAISKGEVAAFQAAESTCDSQYPGCGCASNSVEIEDGVAYGGTSNPTSAVAASCVSRSCLATFTGPTFACGDKLCAGGVDYCEVVTSADGAPPADSCVFTGFLVGDASIGCSGIAIAAGCTCAQSQGNVTVTCH